MEKCTTVYDSGYRSEEQAFLEKFVGRCKHCGHQLKKITTVHRTFQEACGCERVVYPSGLSLAPTHWSITEVDDGEDTGTGCTECEKGSMHQVFRDHTDH